MKPAPFFLIIMICSFLFSCKKNKDTTPPPADIRDQYLGTFNVTTRTRYIAFPSAPPYPRDTTYVQASSLLTVSYAASDSAYYAGGMKPALRFHYSSGFERLMIVDSAGRLYEDFPYHENTGGFITPDSICYVHGEYHTTSSSRDSTWGTRVP